MKKQINQEKEKPKLILEVKDKYDKEFINLILEIEKRYGVLIKQDKLKIESWIKKLCIPTINQEWKKNRNLHAILMLDMIINNHLEEPYDKFANEIQALPLLSKTVVKSKLSKKFQTISISECENNIEIFTNTFLNQFIILPEENNLKENKLLLKQITHRSKSSDNSPYAILNKNYVQNNPYVDKKLMNTYCFQKDIEKLKMLLKSLELENKQNEQKKKLTCRVNELESAVENIIKNKDNEGVLKSVKKILNKK